MTAHIIADRSIWIDHFNKGDVEPARLVRRREIALHAMIVAKIALGSLSDRYGTLEELSKLPRSAAASHDDVMALIEEHGLFGRGIGYVDAHLLAAAVAADVRFWTRDKRLHAAAERLGVAVDLA